VVVVVVVMMILIMILVRSMSKDEKLRGEWKDYPGEEEYKTIIFIKLLFDVLLFKKNHPSGTTEFFVMTWV
jgi:hypothetical protein